MYWVDFFVCLFLYFVAVIVIYFSGFVELFIQIRLRPIFAKRQLQTPQNVAYLTYVVQNSVAYFPCSIMEDK